MMNYVFVMDLERCNIHGITVTNTQLSTSPSRDLFLIRDFRARVWHRKMLSRLRWRAKTEGGNKLIYCYLTYM